MKTQKIAFIIVFVFAIKFWVYQPYVVSSNSMNSTLLQGDYLIVNKWENSILGNHVKPKKNDVIAFHYPLDKGDIADKLVYIKRCVGIPGETITIENGLIDSCEKALQFDYIITDPNSKINWETLNNIDVYLGGKTINNNWILSLSDKQIKSLKSIDNELIFQKLTQDVKQFDLSTFPSDTLIKWNRDFYGPIYIPKSGHTIKINLENISLYRKIIEIYENHTIEVNNSNIIIDKKIADTYTFEQNYYFMMGDNRHHSKDSRHWGFVPEDHLIASCAIVIFNIDNFSSKRLLKTIN
tara:strand:+ start:3873 stop:4760 length:888 start_codon:yes stop_codon:yes gene_type:complete